MATATDRPAIILAATALLLAFGFLQASSSETQSATGNSTNNSTKKAWLINMEGAIGPATSHYVLRGLAKAAEADARLVLLQMDTPGGLDAAMRDIIQGILSSEVPVVSWVGPKGARAASAGTYISYASHVAAMAPATNLGAATPVQLAAPKLPTPAGEEDAGTPGAMERKMVNDAAAYMRGLAELRNRNADWAEKAVREGVSLDAETALAEKVIDLIALDLNDLLAQLDGRIISMDGEEMTLETAGVEMHAHEPDWRTEILTVITNPSIVLILGMIGIYGIILEFYNPGSLIPGVVGLICLLLAAYSVQLLPLNYAGLALLVLGIGLIVAEALLPSFGILGIGGIIAFCIGGLMLFDSELEAFRAGLPIVAAIALISALFIIATVNIAMKMRHKRVTTGKSALIGEEGEALSDFAGEGQVRVGGEIWRAKSSGEISAGNTVTILAVDGLLLRVEKIEGENS